MKLLLYCTKAKPILFKPFEWDCFPNDEASRFYLGDSKTIEIDEELNGKIVAECEFEVEKIVCVLRNTKEKGFFEEYTTKSLSEKELLYASKIDEISFINYLDSKDGYGIHIKNLHIFGKPKELNDYYKTSKINTFDGYDLVNESIDKAPQNMMYCYNEKGKKYALISIRPKWLCKILNGEKTIEVRKKVLKEMLNDK